MRYFKLPLIVTGVVLVLALIAGVVSVTMVHRARVSDREKTARAEKAGLIVGVSSLVLVTPFWLVASVRFGRERRLTREAAAGTEQHPH